MQEDAGGGQLCVHIRQPELEALKLVDGFSERLPLTHIGQRLVQRLLRAAKGRGGDVQTPAIEARHGVGKALALFADQVVGDGFRAIHLDLRGGLGSPAHLVFETAE